MSHWKKSAATSVDGVESGGEKARVGPSAVDGT